MSFTRPHLSTTWSLPYCLSNGWLTSRIDYIHPASGNLIGQLTNVIDPLGSVTNWYNNQGLLVAVSNAVGRVKSVVYDLEDRPASVTDANGITVSHVYDNLGRLRTRTWPDNNTENWGYSTGYTGPTSYTNQLGGLYRTLFEYDPLDDAAHGN